MARLYDLMLVIDSSAPEERQVAVREQVERAISSGGTLVSAHDWGTRRLAYDIDHRPEGAFHLFQLEAEADLLEQLRHSLKIMDGVLRFRIIRVRSGTPAPTPPRDAGPRREEREQGSARVAARAAADAPPDPESTG